MKETEAIKLAVKEYKKRLKENGSSEFAIAICITAGIDFLNYYKKFKNKLLFK